MAGPMARRRSHHGNRTAKRSVSGLLKWVTRILNKMLMSGQGPPRVYRCILHRPLTTTPLGHIGCCLFQVEQVSIVNRTDR